MPEYKKLFNEQCINETTTNIIEESTGVKKMYIEGVFLGAEKRNRNGRIYPHKLIEREVNKFQSLIETHESLGELSHPSTGEINPDRAAILITDLHMDGDFAIGKAKVLSTPCGKILEALISDGVRMGVSSRGTGNLLEDNIVADDFSLITVDAVYLPSCPDAYQEAMYESVKTVSNWVLNEATGLYIEREIMEQTNPATETPIVTPEKAEVIAQATETFIKKIDRKGSKEIKNAFKEWFKTL